MPSCPANGTRDGCKAGEGLADRGGVEQNRGRGEERRDPDDRPGGDRGERFARPVEVRRAGGGQRSSHDLPHGIRDKQAVASGRTMDALLESPAVLGDERLERHRRPSAELLDLEEAGGCPTEEELLK